MKFPAEHTEKMKICWNTLMATLEALTDFQANAIA
jgi:hypothetical protein